MDSPILGLPSGLLGDRERTVPVMPELQACEVHDVLAYGRCYIVKPMGLPRMPAMLGSQSSSMLPIGTRDITMLVPGSLVLCWISEQHYAVILAVLTSPMGSSQMSWPDSIVAAGHAGIFADQAHQILSTKETSHGFLDFSGGGPIDSLPGDWGKTNELGMALFLGRLMASMRAGELCKLEMHYTDMLARLYAYNWQHYTSGSEDEAFDDEGEFTRIRGFSPYPWEAAGIAKKDKTPFDKKDALNPKDAGDRIGIEPINPLQTSFVRYKEFEGFLGDLRRRFVMMPVLPSSLLSAIVSGPPTRLFGRTQKDSAQYKGLMEEVVGIDGSWLLRSAKSIGLEKTIWIPVPEDLYPRDNPKGEHDFTNSAGAGMDFTEYPDQGTSGKNIARLRDSQSHDLNKRKSAPLNNRPKDWAIRDDIDAEKGAIATPGDFKDEIAPLASYSTFEQPLPPNQDEIVASVGDRKSKFYQSKAFMGILPDGSILMRDGYGSEIRMCGGNIELTCPGDVVMRTGRTMQFWGGKDVIIKSHENLELSAAKGSARLKAEHNLEVLGGNDEKGGVLIESRGSGDTNKFSTIGDSVVIGGLVMKSSRGTVSIYGKSLFMCSMAGDITMDSQAGSGNFIIYTGQLTKYLSGGSKEVVAGKKSETGVTETFVMENRGSTFSFLGTQATFGVSSLSIVAAKGSSATTNLTIAGGITAEGTVSGVGAFGEGTKPSVSALADVRKEAINSFSANNTTMKTMFKQDITGEIANGNKEVYGRIGFSFRASGDLGLGGMIIYEAEWQKRFRQTASIKADAKYTSVWEEPLVAWHVNPDTGKDDTGGLTMPFPGKEAWVDGQGAQYSQVDDQFYLTKVNSEDTGGRPLPRGEKGAAYDLKQQAPQFSEKEFKARYPINR